MLNSSPSHLPVCTIRGIGLTKNGSRTISELSFPGLVPRPSWRPRISACYRVHDWRRYAGRLPFLLQFDFGSSFLEGPARQVFSRPDAGRNFIHSSRCGKAFEAALSISWSLVSCSLPYPFFHLFGDHNIFDPREMLANFPWTCWAACRRRHTENSERSFPTQAQNPR